ncbi:MAG: TIGR00269 family protein [Euryarchaeota archaeon]|nr:TIGR00269 family protein [Euryarchaeota archaeon]MDE1837766.1 TIGR00269 family protein [Euryarchaeota archaeon]MDE1880195.1 TIGR00269 family protein [Euryarchaeota archaeon]MDE2045412.1 TIGR00269 family protein [Thermoplasmata archaeon]
MECTQKGCGGRALIDQPYAGAHLCAAHFRASVVERARRELHHQAPRLKGGTLALALSGGKDSAVMTTLVHRILGGRQGLQLVALTVDEGIEGYRAETIAPARKLCRTLGIEHVVRSFEQVVGTTTDATSAALPEEIPCSFCGVWRRRALNQMAREVGAVRLSMGFNLDDLAQTVLMNLARGEPHRLRQMAPHVEPQAGLVPRIAPLAMVPEREVYLYARLEGLPFDHAVCPHASRAGRNVFREVLWRLEEAVPGTRHALLRTREKLLPLLLSDEGGAGSPHRCRTCGEPSSGEVCRPCAYREALSGLTASDFISAPGSGRT